ncbi:CPBP family intramembrane glutamic endopeptidase [Flavobacterium sp. UMI-01]|uniref:CPBP family intramembrane glutamic endopeptidase n=1 Tax=Flavobacterium sp. UMI-01 TaxID=1441053 RepID=UPI001C7DFBD4|nr:CPBP family intramembrane glutamic endopeptidase [Flavobacterium sp. UMI-01]GIZ08232.1 abortive infection protein [Flavobacterium sp. UMI-01]
MFVEQGVTSGNKFWKYIIGSLLLIAISFLGQIPLLLGIFYHVFFNKATYPTTNKELMHFFDANVILLLILLPSVLALFGFFYIIRRWHQQSIRSITTSRKKIDSKRILFSFSIWSVFIALTTLGDYILNPNQFVFNFNPTAFIILVIVGGCLIPFQTSLEEYVFRGYLMQGFANLAKNKWFPLLMTSVLFGLMHFFNPEVSKMGNIIFVYYIGTGLFLGIITLMDEGMELALGFHAANNLVSALLVTTDWSAFQTNSILKDISIPEAGFDIILPVFVIYPMLLFIFSRKYQWINWKEKLTGIIH